MCEVDTGEATRTIVCGAPNVAAGQTVPVALPGAVLPGGRSSGAPKLRGVTSDGMILSEAELQIGDDADGIAVWTAETAPGTPLAEVSAAGGAGAGARGQLEPRRLPRRLRGGAGGACVQRRAAGRAAVGGATPRPPARARRRDYASVTVEVPELCPRFTARVFTEVTIGPSPLWLKARLVAAGQRPINNVVDITNYVMLLTAQPLHAFDLDRVPDGALIIRTAADGEQMTTLDGVERTLRRRVRPGLRPQGALRDRRDHGRPDLGGLRLDHPRPARGRDLERGEHPAHLAQAGVALGGVQPVREAASPRAGDPRPAHRVEADGRDLRGEARARDDRRRRRAAACAPGAAAPAPRRLAAGDADRAASSARPTWSGSASGSSARATT